jgi:MoxR-like ATPase
LPIGWINEFLLPRFNHSQVRIEIVVEAPPDLDGSQLSVVDPDNISENGYPFVAIPGSSGAQKQLFVAVPLFAMGARATQITYALRHETAGWDHGFEPVRDLHGSPTVSTSATDPLMKLYTIEFLTEIPNYIVSAGSVSSLPEFYVALDEVRPSIPEKRFTPTAAIVNRFGDDALLRLAVKYAHSNVARFALAILARRCIGVSALASRLLALCQRNDDGRTEADHEAMLSGAITALASFIRAEEQSGENQRKASKGSRANDPGITRQGFLCDQPHLWMKHESSDALLAAAAQLLSCPKPLFDAEALLRTPGFLAKIPRFIATEGAKSRLDEVCYGLHSGIPLLIQGPTSASKSATAHVASIGLFGSPPLVYALSEQTEVADLLGRKLLRQSWTALLTFIPGVLTHAYTTGRVLLLDEFDLCSPKILACILSALDGSVIDINATQYQRHPRFRLIATLNGETAGFTSRQRNVLLADILARFHTISFAGLSRGECNEIFSKLIPKSIPHSVDLSQRIADLHTDIQAHFSNQTPEYRDMTRGEAAMTLRNFSAALAIIEFGHYNPRDACAVAYLAQLPQSERLAFHRRLAPVGTQSMFNVVKKQVIGLAKDLQVHAHDQFIDAAVHALIAAPSGLHVMLEGPTGAGLTTLAKFIALCCMKDGSTHGEPNDIPWVLLGPESFVDDIIGSFRPQSLSDDGEDPVTYEIAVRYEIAVTLKRFAITITRGYRIVKSAKQN